MEIRDIITNFFNILEEIDGIKYNSTKYSREAYIESFSIHRDSFYKYFNVNNQNGSRALKRSLKVNLEKPTGSSWFSYILYLFNHKICSKCNKLKTLDNFYNRSVGKSRNSECKQCGYERHKEWRSFVKAATPIWADLNKIDSVYLNRPEGYHVDHIIPLRGENVCGLHIDSNLQYLKAEENMKKGNKF